MLGWGAWALIGAALLLLSLLAVPVRIVIRSRRQPGDWGDTTVAVTWLGLAVWRGHFVHADFWATFGLQRLRRRLGLRRRMGLHMSGPEPERPKQASGGDGQWRQLAGYIYRLARVRKWRLLLTVGTNDAAVTARLTGVLQAAVGAAAAWLSRQRPFVGMRPHIFVWPDFQRSGLQVDFSCILAVAPAHIICAGAMYAGSVAAAWWQRLRLRRRQGGRQRWPSIPFRA